MPFQVFANTETRLVEFSIDSTKIQIQNNVGAADSVKIEKPMDYDKMAKVSGILGITGLGSMIVFGIVAGLGTFSVLIGALLSITALLLGIKSFRKVKNKKWARLGVILGSLGVLILIAWISFIVYVISILKNGF